MHTNPKKSSGKKEKGIPESPRSSTFTQTESSELVHKTHLKHHSSTSVGKPSSALFIPNPNPVETIPEADEETLKTDAETLKTDAETDCEDSLSSDHTSIGIPPKSLTYMRDNLRNIIGMMGNEKNGCPGTRDCASQDVSVISSEACTPRCHGNDFVQCQPRAQKLLPRENKHPEEVYCTNRIEQCGCAKHPEVVMCETVDERRVEKEPRICGRTRKLVNECSPPPKFVVEACENQCGRYVAPEPEVVKRCPCAVHVPDVPRLTLENEECACDCESGPDSPCIAKRTTKDKIKDLYNRVVGNQDNVYTFQMNNEQPAQKPPRRLIFDLVEGIPSNGPRQSVVPEGDLEKKDHGDLQVHPNKDKKKVKEKEIVKKTFKSTHSEKVEIYYFDHGNSGYYRTTDNPPPLITDDFFEQTDLYATKFWAEIFGTLHIGIAFVTALILQFFRFILYSIVRPLTIGVIQLASDYFFKPLLSILFNGVLQPVLILAYNTATSVRDLCEPIAQGVGFFVRVLADLCKTIRLVEVNVNNESCQPRSSYCRGKPV